MATLNPQGKEILFKVVYYGPGMSGKTTNLQKIYGMEQARGSVSKLMSLATEGERTIFFDYLPISFGQIKGYNVRYQLYTVPGQSYYNATRKIILKGVDGIVFVADSQKERLDENIESLGLLKENLTELGKDINQVALVFQYNKQDMPNTLSAEELNKQLNEYNQPYFSSAVIKGEGVLETLKEICGISAKKIFSK